MKKLKVRIKNWLIIKIAKLRKENRLLRKALKESRDKEKPYIDKINSLKNENRSLKYWLKEVNKNE